MNYHRCFRAVGPWFISQDLDKVCEVFSRCSVCKEVGDIFLQIFSLLSIFELWEQCCLLGCIVEGVLRYVPVGCHYHRCHWRVEYLLGVSLVISIIVHVIVGLGAVLIIVIGLGTVLIIVIGLGTVLIVAWVIGLVAVLIICLIGLVAVILIVLITILILSY